MPIDYSGFALNKPPKKPKSKPSYAVYRQDGTIERVVLSLTDWKKLKRWLWDTHLAIFGFVRCHICQSPIHTPLAYEPDHVKPRGSGGCYRDDRDVKPSHAICNRRKGSIREP
jgi:hypothetical protein